MKKEESTERAQTDTKTDSMCMIQKTEKRINATGTAFDIKTLLVQGKDMKETKKVFDDEWK